MHAGGGGWETALNLHLSGTQVVFNDPRISQLHARVLLEAQSKLRVVDISTNGVFVNGAKIGRGRSQDLAHGDILSLVIIPREVNGAWTHPDQTIANTFVAYRVDFDVKSVVEAQPNGALRANTSPQPLTVPNSQFQLAGFAGQAEDFHAAVEGAEAAAHRQSEVQKESAQRDVGEGSAPLGHQAEMHTPAKTVADVRQGPTPDTSAKVKDEVIARGDGNLPHEQGNAQSSLKTASVQSPGSRVSAMMEADPLARYLKDHRSKDFADGFTLGHLLGEGGFAKVYEGTHKVTLTKVAVKVIDVCKWKFYNRDGGGLRASQLQEEFELHSKVAHPNIVR